jgi:energy-converting hydrogenase Eha subunit H
MWQQWLNAILGLAVIAVPFIGLTTDAFTWTLAVLGIAIAALGVWSAVQQGDMAEYQTRMT